MGSFHTEWRFAPPPSARSRCLNLIDDQDFSARLLSTHEIINRGSSIGRQIDTAGLQYELLQCIEAQNS